MNDIEREIEEGFEDLNEEEIERDDTINKKINYNRNRDNKKVITIIIIILTALVVLGVIFYLVKENEGNDDKPVKDKEVVEEKKEEPKKEEKITYVTCDDNTSLLNVRNSTTGDIIDGLSCFKEIKIEEELEKTEACDKWYKVSYKKHDNNYTGYVCGTYIKESKVSSKLYDEVRETIDKANEYFETIALKPYCGTTSDTKTITYKEDGGSFDGMYVKSEFKNLDELKDYLKSFLSDSLIDNDLKLSDYDNPKMYDNYYEIDGSLYCRNYSGKGIRTTYTDNYDIELEEENNKIIARVAYEYLTDESECEIKNLSKCPNSNFKYKIDKIELEKDNDNLIITKMNFHQ